MKKTYYKITLDKDQDRYFDNLDLCNLYRNYLVDNNYYDYISVNTLEAIGISIQTVEDFIWIIEDIDYLLHYLKFNLEEWKKVFTSLTVSKKLSYGSLSLHLNSYPTTILMEDCTEDEFKKLLTLSKTVL